jgi:hypothetical protein
MPKMRREETGTTHYRFSGKNLKKKLIETKGKAEV